MKPAPHILAFFMLLLWISPNLSAQVKVAWKTLEEEVQYKGKVDPLQFRGEYDPPQFSDSLMALDGKEIIIKGYMLPLTVDRKDYFLSKYSFTECYFCGNGTKESVMEVLLKSEKKKKFPYHEVVSLRGILKLNTDPYKLTYTLVDAVPVK